MVKMALIPAAIFSACLLGSGCTSGAFKANGGSSNSQPGAAGASASDAPTPPAPFEAVAAASYVGKVKGLLTGLAATDAERAAVTADNTTLPGLIDTWLQSPEYQVVLFELFGRLFQQNKVLAIDLGIADQQGSGGGGVSDYLTQVAIRESFARTAVELVRLGRPFTETMTTQTFMMNVPLMVYYGVIEGVQQGETGGSHDVLGTRYPNLSFTYQYATTPTDFNAALSPTNPKYMTFSNNGGSVKTPITPCLINGKLTITPFNANTGVTFTENLFHAVAAFDIYSFSQNSTYCAGPGGVFSWTDSDLAWRMITVRPPKSGEAVTRFWDIPTLRTSKELVVQSPRIGFYTTPAFMGQWASNISNQSRAMISQTMIVGVGQPFDGSSEFTPADLRAVDQNRFAPLTSCFNCHRTLDPMRQNFRQAFSHSGDYQDDPNLLALPGAFVANGQGVLDSNINSLGTLLAKHPQFAASWAKRVCEWATSSTCDIKDAELQRVAQLFVASNYSWNVLMREMLSSPLVTYAKATDSARTYGSVVTITRREQLCRNLSARLALPDVCGLLSGTTVPPELAEVALVAGALPANEFARGQVNQTAVVDPSLTFRAATEKICTALSLQVVGQTASSRYNASDPNAAIADMATGLMGVPSEQRPGVIATLAGHQADASAAGAAAVDALRSTFIVACLSPYTTSLGF